MRAFKFGDNVDTDQIIPARYLTTTDADELARHCMEDADSSFAERVSGGDVIVAGENFGCGSSREHAPIAIVGAGVSGVVAKSFARIFFRNSINLGLALFECPPAVDDASDGDEMELDADSGVLRNRTTGREFRATPLPSFAREIMEAGGLMAYVMTRGRS